MFEEFDQDFATGEVEEMMESCDNTDDLKDNILPLLASQKKQWKAKINKIIDEELHCTKSEFALKVGLSKQTVSKWCNGSIPKTRDRFIRIGLAAGYDIDEINELLQKYGNYPALYSKNLEDCICIYVRLHYTQEEVLEKYEEISQRIKGMIHSQVALKEVKDTNTLEKELAKVQSDEELEAFCKENSSSFSTAYRKLHVYIWEVFDDKKSKIRATSINNMANGQEWSKSLKDCVYEIRKGNWYPTRNKIISLGLHFCMTKEEINEMLTLAGMRPLYAKNVFEHVILYILTSAELNDFYVNDENYDIDSLCNYARGVFDELAVPDFDFFLDELPEVEECEQER